MLPIIQVLTRVRVWEDGTPRSPYKGRRWCMSKRNSKRMNESGYLRYALRECLSYSSIN
ncbi:hypothetical protein HanRHA438_Chr10g0444991 [Helianthus annuus]|nr:hypothetical protein HanRHA438_Chr10g0444991 [Helianthus annuus]